MPSHAVKLDGVEIPWETTWDYLGVTLKSGSSFGCCVKEKLSKFYGALNSILRIEGQSDVMVVLRLLEAHCLPILCYGIEVIHIADRDDRRQLRVAYNAIYRKLSGYGYNESVTLLQHTLNRGTWEELTERRTDSFVQKCNFWAVGTLVRVASSLPS